MTRHKPGESKYHREYRRTVELNNKTLADLHIDQNKFYENNARRQGEKYRSITAKFSDKEMEEAAEVIKMDSKLSKPQDGKSYDEIARMIWGENEWTESKVEHLLYVTEIIAMDLAFNAMRGAGGGVSIAFIPYTKLIEKDGKLVKVVFNA